MFADIFTLGIWLRIDIVFIPGYGIPHSIDWWWLYVAIMAQVTFVTSSFTCSKAHLNQFVSAVFV